MGHIRLGTLPQSNKWREVVRLLESGASVDAIAEAAAKASERDLARASNDPRFQFVASLFVLLPLFARAPGFEAELANLGAGQSAHTSVTGLLSGLELAIDKQSFDAVLSSDAGELAKGASLETLSVRRATASQRFSNRRHRTFARRLVVLRLAISSQIWRGTFSPGLPIVRLIIIWAASWPITQAERVGLRVTPSAWHFSSRWRNTPLRPHVLCRHLLAAGMARQSGSAIR